MNTRTRLIICLALVVLSLLLGACTNPCKEGNACGITAPAGDVQNMVTDWAKDTCPKRADGTCKTMGE